MYTSHGHQIPGTTVEGPTPDRVARCGGPGLCNNCTHQAVNELAKEIKMRFGNKNEGEPEDFQVRARKLVVAEHYATLKKELYTGYVKEIAVDDVYVIWFSKTLQNWKAVLSTTVPNDKIYEVTHNGDKHESYVDTYVKTANTCVTDGTF